MEIVRQTEKKYCSTAMILAIAIGLFCILADQKPVGKGLILGAIFSVINFVLIGETLSTRIGKSRSKTFFASFGTIIFRYFLMAIPLIMAIKLEQLNLFAVISGLFFVQLVLLIDHIFNLTTTTSGKQV